MIIQLTFLPDADPPAPVVMTSCPVVQWIDGYWCWWIDGAYTPQPQLEPILVAQLEREALRKAA